ncbi:MAG: DNA-directed RNA polymerase subunit beta', partial [Phycisphaerales bacterium]
NADFDGDQMAVHLPLSVEAQAETHVLMLATNNIFSPANGSPIMSPSQDMVLGIFYLTTDHVSRRVDEKEMMSFASGHEAMYAHALGRIGLHDFVRVRIDRDKIVASVKGPIEDQPAARPVTTTVGRLLFNDMLPPAMPFYNCSLSQKGAGRVIADCHAILGRAATVELLDMIKDMGFKSSTLAGLSFAVSDLRVPVAKEKIIEIAQRKVDQIERDHANGVLTPMERYNQVIDVWIHAREQVTEAMMAELRNDRRDAHGRYVLTDEEGGPYLNPIFLMTESGARGSVDQIRQLAGMRALMAKPSGEIIETPIKSNFREGLSVLEYFSSTHGARKGLADTALKTADSGYLTRKLADVAQNVIVNQLDCGTINGIAKGATYRGEEIEIPLAEAIIGRVARDSIRNMVTDEMIVAENQPITPEIAHGIEQLGLDKIRVRSPLTCESPIGVCARCYGVDMATGRLVEEGMAVGIIAAQSIGEPGTQLTMRTFHTGGVASRAVVENKLTATGVGVVRYRDLAPVTVPAQSDMPPRVVALKRNGEIVIVDDKDREVESYKVPYGSEILVEAGAKVKSGQALVTWDPHLTPILAEVEGFVRFQDIAEGETVRAEQDRVGARLVVVEHKGEKHPQVIIEDKEGRVLGYHYLPAKARIEVDEGQRILPGMLLARQPRAMSGTQDITGGLPRVTEIFEARRPKEPAVMAEISGAVEIRADKRRGKMTIIVRSESGMEKEHHVPQDKQLLVHAGDRVEAGDPLIEGPLVPYDILRIKGEEALQQYLLTEIQAVYRSQNVSINDKHLEIVMGQMLRRVKIESPGDANVLPGEVLDKFRFRTENERLSKSVRIENPGDTDLAKGQIILKSELEEINDEAEEQGGEPAKGKKPKPATATTVLLGITKASLQSESFISAASFQETTKVLTEVSLASAVDPLLGLKENVILGHLIPAGTAFKPHLNVRVKKIGEPLPVTEELAAEMISPTPEALQASETQAAADGADSDATLPDRLSTDLASSDLSTETGSAVTQDAGTTAPAGGN